MNTPLLEYQRQELNHTEELNSSLSRAGQRPELNPGPDPGVACCERMLSSVACSTIAQYRQTNVFLACLCINSTSTCASQLLPDDVLPCCVGIQRAASASGRRLLHRPSSRCCRPRRARCCSGGCRCPRLSSLGTLWMRCNGSVLSMSP